MMKAPNYATCTPKPLRQTILRLFSFVDEANSIEELMIRAAPERLLAWSLKSTSTCGTVEFRRPPQSLSAEDTIHWVEMTIEIVVWALAADFKDELTLNAPAILTSIARHCTHQSTHWTSVRIGYKYTERTVAIRVDGQDGKPWESGWATMQSESENWRRYGRLGQTFEYAQPKSLSLEPSTYVRLLHRFRNDL